MNTIEFIAIVAIAVPNSIALMKWYWEARKQITTHQLHPTTISNKNDRVLSRQTVFWFWFLIGINGANCMLILFFTETFSRWTLLKLCFSAGILLLTPICFFTLYCYVVTAKLLELYFDQKK